MYIVPMFEEKCKISQKRTFPVADVIVIFINSSQAFESIVSLACSHCILFRLSLFILYTLVSLHEKNRNYCSDCHTYVFCA